MLVYKGDVFGIDLDDDAGVGVRGVAVGGRHAVDHTGVGAAGSGYHVTARAHAERIDTTAVNLRDEAVGGVADIVNEIGFACETAPL